MSDASGREIPSTNDTFQKPQPGYDVQLSLSTPISEFVAREIDQVVAKYHPDHVTMMVEQPSTGKILAMDNYPSFNPEQWRQVSPALYNRNLAVWQTFEPGSTFKIVTLATAIQEHQVTLTQRFYDPGYYEVAGHRIRCWKAGGHGSQTFLQVVENSCNPGFITLGERIGKNALFASIKNFGFGKKTGITLPGESKGILFPLSRVGPLELATTAFGQGVSVTPIQQVMAVGAIANGGLLMKPLLVEKYINPETKEVVQAFMPQIVRRVVSEATAAQVRDALEHVVAQGTGANAFQEGYRIAGKTGTAQVVENGHYSRQHYIVSFIGMAPANHPVLVAYVAIDYPRPKNSPVFGGTIAAPVIGHVLADSLQIMHVAPSTNGIPKRFRFGIDPSMTQVLNLSGMKYQDAVRQMMNSGLILRVSVSGHGDYVVSQRPAAGEFVPQGSTIRLYLGQQP